MANHPGSRRDFLSVGSLGFLGLTLSDYLQAAAAKGPAQGKATSVILLWLEGGPSHIDTWDPKPNSNFKPISTNVAGIQVSELLPTIAKKMDKIALVRSMHTRGNDHPQATHYAITGHEINPAMQFASLEDDPHARGARRIRFVEGVGQNQGAIRQGCYWPVRSACPPAGGSGQPLRDRGGISFQFLGYAQRQRQGPSRPPRASARPHA